jgi:ubiquinone/menaquinone biosynthesis C-methylase UbiE
VAASTDGGYTDDVLRERGIGLNPYPVAARYENAQVAASYDRLRFHSLGGRYKNFRVRRLLGQILSAYPSDGIVLDIPCGTGRIDTWLLDASRRVIAADISKAMLTVARQKAQPKGSWLQFLRADARFLPLRSQSVDGVFCIRFLHLLDEPARLSVLRELARVTRQWVVVEYRVERRVKTLKRALLSWFGGRPRRRKMTIPQITDELSRCGLRAGRSYFVSRWFSGSVLVTAHRQNLRSEEPCRPVRGVPQLSDVARAQ